MLQMQAELFGELRETYELFDSMRYHVIRRAERTAAEANESNEHFIKSLCPHLQYRKANETKTRIYRINK